MKTPYLLYFGALLALFVADYAFNVIPQQQFIAAGKEQPLVQTFLAELEAPIDATTGPVAQRSFSIGYLYRTSVYPGFRLVHDPSLGKEVIATGPAAALDYLELSDNSGRLTPDFTRPVRLSERVEIRVNLEAHGSHHMRIDLYEPQAKIDLQPDLVTEGPLTFRLLKLRNLPDHPIEINTADLVVPAREQLHYLTGTTDRLELLHYETDSVSYTPTNLEARTVIKTDIKAKD
jgi:hypothetical protein